MPSFPDTLIVSAHLQIDRRRAPRRSQRWHTITITPLKYVIYSGVYILALTRGLQPLPTQETAETPPPSSPLQVTRQTRHQFRGLDTGS